MQEWMMSKNIDTSGLAFNGGKQWLWKVEQVMQVYCKSFNYIEEDFSNMDNSYQQK